MNARVFSDEDLAAIERTVQDAEARTASQIVVVVAERSSRYFAHRAVAAFSVVVALALLVYLLFPVVSPGLILTGEVLLAPLLWLLFGARPLLLALVPDDFEQAEVEARAKVAFVDHRVFDTEGHAGVLLYLSLFEHRVEVLADTGVPPRLVQRSAATVVDGMRAGRPAAAVCAAVEELGDELSRLFPTNGESRRRLPDVHAGRRG